MKGPIRGYQFVLILALGAWSTLIAGGLNDLETQISSTKNLSEYLSNSNLFRTYTNALQSYVGGSTQMCPAPSATLQQIKELDGKLKGFSQKLWSRRSEESFSYRAAKSTRAYYLRAVPRALHAIWLYGHQQGCDVGGCTARDQILADRWTVALNGAQTFVLEENNKYTGSMVIALPVQVRGEAYSLVVPFDERQKLGKEVTTPQGSLSLLEAFLFDFKKSTGNQLAVMLPVPGKSPGKSPGNPNDFLIRQVASTGKPDSVLIGYPEARLTDPMANSILALFPRSCAGAGDASKLADAAKNPKGEGSSEENFATSASTTVTTGIPGSLGGSANNNLGLNGGAGSSGGSPTLVPFTKPKEVGGSPSESVGSVVSQGSGTGTPGRDQVLNVVVKTPPQSGNYPSPYSGEQNSGNTFGKGGASATGGNSNALSFSSGQGGHGAGKGIASANIRAAVPASQVARDPNSPIDERTPDRTTDNGSNGNVGRGNSSSPVPRSGDFETLLTSLPRLTDPMAKKKQMENLSEKFHKETDPVETYKFLSKFSKTNPAEAKQLFKQFGDDLCKYCADCKYCKELRRRQSEFGAKPILAGFRGSEPHGQESQPETAKSREINSAAAPVSGKLNIRQFETCGKLPTRGVGLSLVYAKISRNALDWGPKGKVEGVSECRLLAMDPDGKIRGLVQDRAMQSDQTCLFYTVVSGDSLVGEDKKPNVNYMRIPSGSEQDEKIWFEAACKMQPKDKPVDENNPCKIAAIPRVIVRPPGKGDGSHNNEVIFIDEAMNKHMIHSPDQVQKNSGDASESQL
jgi:hypothetical protein